MLLRNVVVCLLVVSAQAAHADTIKLKSGDELNARILEVTADTVIIDHPELGRVKIPRDKVETDLGDKLNPGLFGTGFMRGWNRRIDLGINGSQGNSIATNITGGLNFNYKDKRKRWLVTGRYFFQRDETGPTDNNARLDLRRDWLLPDSPWFAYGAMRYQYDQFESWLHRIVVSAGPGYNLFKREKQALDVRLGPAYTRDFGGGGTNKAEVLTAIDYSWKPRKRFKFTLSNLFFTEVGPSPGEFRNVTLAQGTMRLLDDPELDLIIGGENEYESDLRSPDKKNTLRYYMTFGMNF